MKTFLLGALVAAFVFSLGLVRPVPVRAAEEIAIRYSSGDARIAASLILPEGEGPHPAAVFLHGSGPHTRDDQRPYADLFLEAGVAVLLSDKRGSGESTGHWELASLHDLASDAARGIALLRDRDEIDASRVGLYGASQAGWVAPLVNTLDEPIAFFVIASGGGIPPMENERWAYDRALDGLEVAVSKDERARAHELLDRYFDYLSTGRGRDALVGAIEAVKNEPWYAALDLERVLPSAKSRPAWEWVATFDPIPLVEKMRAPTLLLFGARDEVQPTELAVAAWREGLEHGGHESFVIRVFPDAGHSLRNGGMAEHHGPADGAPFAEGLASYVRDWLSANVLAPE